MFSKAIIFAVLAIHCASLIVAQRTPQYNNNNGGVFPVTGGSSYAPSGNPGFNQNGGYGYVPSGSPGFNQNGGYGYAPSGNPGFNQNGGSGYAPSGSPGFNQNGGSGYAPSGSPGSNQNGGSGYAPSGSPGFNQNGGSGYDTNNIPNSNQNGAQNSNVNNGGAAPAAYFPSLPTADDINKLIDQGGDAFDDLVKQVPLATLQAKLSPELFQKLRAKLDERNQIAAAATQPATNSLLNTYQQQIAELQQQLLQIKQALANQQYVLQQVAPQSVYGQQYASPAYGGQYSNPSIYQRYPNTYPSQYYGSPQDHNVLVRKFNGLAQAGEAVIGNTVDWADGTVQGVSHLITNGVKDTAKFVSGSAQDAAYKTENSVSVIRNGIAA